MGEIGGNVYVVFGRVKFMEEYSNRGGSSGENKISQHAHCFFLSFFRQGLSV